MSFDNDITEAQKETNRGGDFWKPEEGDNKIRIISEPAMTVSVFFPKEKKSKTCYKGAEYCTDEFLEKNELRRQVKFLTYILVDNTIKLYTMPYSIAEQLKALKDDSTVGTGFENFPVPFDTVLKVKNAGSKEVDYQLVSARENTEVPKEILEKLETMDSPEEVVEKMKNKALETASQNESEEQATAEDSPF